MIDPEKYYSFGDSANMVACGKCWLEEIAKTKSGGYTGIECVYEDDLVLVDQDEPWQCDICLDQNDAYDELGEDF